MHNTLITFDRFVDKFMATEPVLLSSCVVGLVLRGCRCRCLCLNRQRLYFHVIATYVGSGKVLRGGTASTWNLPRYSSVGARANLLVMTR